MMLIRIPSNKRVTTKVILLRKTAKLSALFKSPEMPYLAAFMHT